MSMTILAFAVSFSKQRLSATEFANAYIELWKIEGDKNILQKDEDELSECLSTIFCLADLYNPDADRDDYELNEDELRTKVKQLIAEFGGQ